MQECGFWTEWPRDKYLAYNVEVEQPLCTIDGTVLEQKDDFKYLGSWADSSEKDIGIRKAFSFRNSLSPQLSPSCYTDVKLGHSRNQLKRHSTTLISESSEKLSISTGITDETL